MIPNTDLQRWQQAITSITAAQNELSPEELSAFQTLLAFINSSNFEASGSGGYIQIIKNALSQHAKNRLLKAHLTNFVALSEKYFTAQTTVVSSAPSVSQPLTAASTSVPTNQPSAEVKATPPPQVAASAVPPQVATADISKWQQAINGITAIQKDLSPDELSAFQSLIECYNRGDFETGGNNSYIQILKKSTTKNRLLKAHLTNFITLCEKYFKEQVTTVASIPVPTPTPAPTPVVSPPQVTPPAFEPPTFEPPVIVPPTIQPSVEEIPTPQKPQKEPSIATPQKETVSEQKVEIPFVQEPSPVSNATDNKNAKPKNKKSSILLIVLLILGVTGFIVIKNYKDIHHFINCRVLDNCPIDSLMLNKTALVFEEEGATEQLIFTVQPINGKVKTINWHSSNDSVAIVDSVGFVTAVASGSAIITVLINNEHSATCQVTVEIVMVDTDTIPSETILPIETNTTVPEDATKQAVNQPVKLEKSNSTTQSNSSKTSGTISVSGGTYTGELKDGKPHGMGTIRYNSYTLIDSRDVKERHAEAGQSITGQFKDGRLLQGKLYDKNGNQIDTIIIGGGAY